MINTFNESSLHKALKTLYSLENGDKTEEKIGQWICDIVKNDERIIEIQTANVSSLRSKIEGLLALNKKVTIVHPIVVTKTIQMTDEQNIIISNRKSPIKQNIYSVFKQLTGLYTILLNPNFNLELPEITMTECRIKTATKVQTKNKKRRFPKNWLKSDKKLTQILQTQYLNNAIDYLNLLPQYENQQILIKNDFTVKETAELLSTKYNKRTASHASIMLWVLKRMNLIEEIYIEKRQHHYKVVDKYINKTFLK